MTEDINSYRFGRGEEPTDEMLAQIMHEAAVDAKKRSDEATRAYFDEISQMAKNIPLEIKKRLDSLRNA